MVARCRRILAPVTVALAVLVSVFTMGLVNASPVSAATQIGWVLDTSGSVQCVVADGTNNHVLCYHYPAGGGAASLRLDTWAPYACLGGAFMQGGGSGSPGYLYLQNVSGYYCGYPTSFTGYASFYRVGTCSNSSNWYEGSTWADINQVASTYNKYPYGRQFDFSSIAFPDSRVCNAGNSRAVYQFWN